MKCRNQHGDIKHYQYTTLSANTRLTAYKLQKDICVVTENSSKDCPDLRNGC